jgi:hypothetical protein
MTFPVTGTAGILSATRVAKSSCAIGDADGDAFPFPPPRLNSFFEKAGGESRKRRTLYATIFLLGTII